MKYTFLGDWATYSTPLVGERFAIVTEAATYTEALKSAAHAFLAHFPELQEFHTPASLWEGEEGAVILMELYGDRTADLVDRDAFEIIRAHEAPA
ncbi:hypothetical protein RCO28_34725 [Streptomyces sp. LHD-70]|uniref:hypothetical protein n=1 Tax=Streptomyces sp. LHD-70 TaxID=3072140 RepID=UPI0028100710|nr:hypothetical protein [Streptomyces sp. LHD-70]MDQ8707589.1 hypothetical protein [Streptomyces sp. LHD-70]